MTSVICPSSKSLKINFIFHNLAYLVPLVSIFQGKQICLIVDDFSLSTLYTQERRITDVVRQKLHVLMVREIVIPIQNVLKGLCVTQITVHGIVQQICVCLMSLVHVHQNLVILIYVFF